LDHIQQIEFLGTHRLIPAKYAGQSVLEELDLPANVISDLSELDSVTNELMIAERARNAAIGPGELLYGVPEAQIVNAAFTHPGPFGARFNSSRRGAWYAGVELKTSLNEVAHHKRRFLKDARIKGRYTFEYADFLADFSGEFHTLDDEELKTCLVPEPTPQCYAPSQVLAETLLNRGSNGIVYPSVRYPSGTCIVCFRPALVFHPRRGNGYRLSIDARTRRFNSEEFALNPRWSP
jgi:RES domain-containing protein